MAANYTDLKSEIATWLARSGDSNITDNVDTFIDLAEGEFNRVLRTDDMITEATLSLSAGVQTVARPSDYLQAVSAYNTTDPQSIEFASTKQIRDRYATSSTGLPRYFSEYADDKFLFGPAPDSGYSVTLVYFQKIPALGVSQATNWLLDVAPDLYLYRTLYAARGFMQDDSGVSMWKQISDGIIGDLQAADNKDRFSGATLQQRPYGNKP